MADKELLKLKFMTGRKPTGADFAYLIDAIFEQNDDTPIPTTPVAIDVKGPVKFGFYGQLGDFRQPSDPNGEGTGWRAYYVEITPGLKYEMVFPRPISFRIAWFNGTNLITRDVATNGQLSFPANCTAFAINVPINQPDLHPVPATPTIAESELNDLKIMTVHENLRLELKVLFIGNSFSGDVNEYIHNICASAGVGAIFGDLYRPGESLEGHMAQVTANANSYTYHKRSSIIGPTHSSTSNTSLLTALKDENWDIVVYQQASPLSGSYATFNPYLRNLISFVNQNKTNPNAKNAIHMTWAYSGQDEMYGNIVSAYRQAMFDNNIDIIIPTGTAIENARTIPHLQTIDNDLTEDGTHLGALGDYIGGLTVFESLVSAKYKKNIFEDVSYSVHSKYHSYLSKLAVKNAVLNPFKVTGI